MRFSQATRELQMLGFAATCKATPWGVTPRRWSGQMPPPERMTAASVFHECVPTRLIFMAGTKSFPDMVVSQRWSSA